MNPVMAKKGNAQPIEDDDREPVKPATGESGRTPEREARAPKAGEGGGRAASMRAYLRDLAEEVKKVAWPSWMDARRASIAVGIIVLYSMAILMAVDVLTTMLFRRFLPGG